MGYFNTLKNVNEYIKMAKGYDGRELINILRKNLLKGSHVLEIGMGPGKDLDILKETYTVTGSDYSQIFLDLYRKKHTDADLLLIDAIKMNTTLKFDCIYSNKVLQHLIKPELKESFKNQYCVLKENGIVFHTFWYGDKEEEFEGLRFVYYTEDILKEYFDDYFTIIEIKKYKEMKKNDSFYVILRKRE